MITGLLVHFATITTHMSWQQRHLQTFLLLQSPLFKAQGLLPGNQVITKNTEWKSKV